MKINFLGKEVEISKTTVAVMVAVLVVVIGVVGVIISQKSGEVVIDKTSDVINDSPLIAKNTTTLTSNSSTPTVQNSEVKNEDEMKVYVVGCVKKEGVVTLKKGQIIDDAIKAAGGATKNADLRKTNLACELNDHDMLVIYSKNTSASKTTVNSSSSTSAMHNTSGSKIIKGSGGSIITQKSTTKSASSKININQASVSELDALPGVGPATAQKIVAYRNTNGKFVVIEDIKKVAGIGDSKYDSMKDLISVK